MLPLYDTYQKIQKQKFYGPGYSDSKQNSQNNSSIKNQNNARFSNSFKKQNNIQDFLNTQKNGQILTDSIYNNVNNIQSGALSQQNGHVNDNGSSVQSSQRSNQNYYELKQQLQDDRDIQRQIELQQKQQQTSKGFQNAFNKINPQQNNIGLITLQNQLSNGSRLSNRSPQSSQRLQNQQQQNLEQKYKQQQQQQNDQNQTIRKQYTPENQYNAYENDNINNANNNNDNGNIQEQLRPNNGSKVHFNNNPINIQDQQQMDESKYKNYQQQQQEQEQENYQNGCEQQQYQQQQQQYPKVNFLSSKKKNAQKNSNNVNSSLKKRIEEQKKNNKSVVERVQEVQLLQQQDTISHLLYSEDLFGELFTSPNNILGQKSGNVTQNEIQQQLNLNKNTSINSNHGINDSAPQDQNGFNSSSYSEIQKSRNQQNRGNTMSTLNLYSQGNSQFQTPKGQKKYISKVAHQMKSAQMDKDLTQNKSFYNSQQVTLRDIIQRQTKYDRQWIQDDSILDPEYKEYCRNNSATSFKFRQQLNKISVLKEKQGLNVSNLKSLDRSMNKSMEKINKDYDKHNSTQRINLYKSFNGDADLNQTYNQSQNQSKIFNQSKQSQILGNMISYSNINDSTVNNGLNKSLLRYTEVNNSHTQNVNQDRRLQRDILNSKCIHNLKTMYCDICARKINSNNQNYRSTNNN